MPVVSNKLRKWEYIDSLFTILRLEGTKALLISLYSFHELRIFELILSLSQLLCWDMTPLLVLLSKASFLARW